MSSSITNDSEFIDHLFRDFETGWFYGDKDQPPTDIDDFADITKDEYVSRWEAHHLAPADSQLFLTFLRSTHFVVIDEGFSNSFRITNGTFDMYVSSHFVDKVFGSDIFSERKETLTKEDMMAAFQSVAALWKNIK